MSMSIWFRRGLGFTWYDCDEGEVCIYKWARGGWTREGEVEGGHCPRILSLWVMVVVVPGLE